MRQKLGILAVLVLLLPVGCRSGNGKGSTSGTSTGTAGTTGGATGGLLTILEPNPSGVGNCDAHAAFVPQFTDVTDAWGLGDGGLWMVGNRILSADLDNDGYPDLIVHAIYSQERETIPSFWDGVTTTLSAA